MNVRINVPLGINMGHFHSVFTSASDPGLQRDEPEWVQISLGRAQLLSLRFDRSIYTRSLMGTHWISWNGRDVLLEQGQVIKLTAGVALIDGEGVMQVAVAESAGQGDNLAALRKWLGWDFMASRAQALRIDING